MQGDLNEDLLKVNRLEQILNKLNLCQLIKEPTRITPRSKTLIDVIITNNRDSVIHAETSLSIAITMLSAVRLISESKEWHHFKSKAEIMPIIPLKFFKLNLCNSLINWTYCMKLIVSILKFKLTDNFLLALDSCAPFEVKLIKRPPARWMTATITNKINKKYILSHEYKSIVEDTATVQKEAEYKP